MLNAKNQLTTLIDFISNTVLKANLPRSLISLT